MSNKYADLIKNARVNAECGEHMSPAEVTTLLNVVETTFSELAAENAGLKEEISNITFMRDDDFFGSTQRAQEVMGRLVNVKTPATDAFLAEVRASALPVEIAEIIDSGDLEAILYSSGYSEAERYRMALYNFRTSRKGVQS